MYLYVLVCSVHEKFFISKEKIEIRNVSEIANFSSKFSNFYQKSAKILKSEEFESEIERRSCDKSCDRSCDRSKKSRGVWETSRDSYKNWRSVDECKVWVLWS